MKDKTHLHINFPKNYCQEVNTQKSLPPSGGVCSAFWDSGWGNSVRDCGGDCGGGVSLRNGDLLSLASLLSAVGTEALPHQHRGTSTMEAVGDVDIRLALHERPLYNE